MSSGFRATLILTLVVFTGCENADSTGARDLPPGVLGALQEAERYELLSLDPDAEKGVGGADESAFYGWHVLGRLTISDPVVRRRLTDALHAGVQENDGTVAACFEPRHGISVTSGETVTDLVICFQCFSALVYKNGQQADGFLTTGSPQPAFDDVLRSSGVPLAKPAD